MTHYNINLRLLFSFMIVFFFILLLRSYGFYPYVFADEYFYNKFSRLTSLSESPIPNYLYFAIYRITNICHDDFLNCARCLNTLFFISSAPFIYFITNKVAGKKTSLLVSLLTLAGPINSYTVYFMPESFYFFGFWVFSYILLKLNSTSLNNQWILGGFVLGCLSLIKPHALFLLPAMALYSLYIARQTNQDRWLIISLKITAILASMTLFSKLFFGFILAGKGGLTLFGDLYSGMASTVSHNYGYYKKLLTISITPFIGNFLTISFIYSVPCAILLSYTPKYFERATLENNVLKISVYTLTVLTTLILIVSLYTASISMNSTFEASRLHLRYYNFSLPLLLIIAASQITPERIMQSSRSTRLIIGLLVILPVIYAIISRLTSYTHSHVDCPELSGFSFNPSIFLLLGFLSLISLCLWVFNSQLGSKIFLFIYFPLAVLYSTFYVNNGIQLATVPNAYDKAGTFTRTFLNKNELSNLMLISPDPYSIYKVNFYVDVPENATEILSENSKIDLNKYRDMGKEWILLVGKYNIPENVYKIESTFFTLINMPNPHFIDFKNDSWPGVISSIRGLGGAETWGAWSTDKSVIIEFLNPLPEHFTLHLKAGAFGPNINLPFLVKVGNEIKPISLISSFETVRIIFNNPSRSNTIFIEIPQPTSPKELGISNDPRKLGISLYQLKIET